MSFLQLNPYILSEFKNANFVYMLYSRRYTKFYGFSGKAATRLAHDAILGEVLCLVTVCSSFDLLHAKPLVCIF